MTSFQVDMCRCGHPVGDHASGRTTSLRPPRFGVCKRAGCPCRKYQPAPKGGSSK